MSINVSLVEKGRRGTNTTWHVSDYEEGGEEGREEGRGEKIKIFF
jgi:hypothetical protein